MLLFMAPQPHAPHPQDAALAADTAVFRQFNRVYTRFLGTLSEGFLRTEFSLAEGRVIYELATRPKAQAKEIGETLGLDAGYLSRILTKFEKAGPSSAKHRSTTAEPPISSSRPRAEPLSEPSTRAPKNRLATS